MRLSKIFLYSLLSTTLFYSALSFADERPVAGEVVKHDKPSPHGVLEPTHNVTDIFKPVATKDEEPDVFFEADELIYHEKEKQVEAIGNVEVRRENLTVYADKLIYYQTTDNIQAIGNVRLEDGTGNTVYADKVNLKDKMSTADMMRIKAILSDESKIWAKYFYKKANDNKVMRHAIYTPCDFCEADGMPLWRIRARKITHDAQNKDINYNDAVLDFKGVPVLYTPFLSHPDPSVKRRSGFLLPSIGSSSYLGGALYLRYFWDVNPQTNILFTPILTTEKDVVWGGQYEQYFNKGYINFQGSYLKDDDDDRPSDRGHIFATGRYELNDKWVADTDLKYVSDNLYLKELDLDHDDDAWLTSSARLQMFDNRDYASIEAYYYKLISYDLRTTDMLEYERRKANKPFVAPLIDYELVSTPSSIGSYFKNEFNMASVYHESDLRTHRASMINSWVLPWTSPFGERYRVVASVKSDAYNVENFINAQNEDIDGDVTRMFPQLGLEWRLPFVKATETTRQIVEPVVVAVAAPNGGNKSNKIPNEDSEDLEFDDTNILSLDRFSGYDRNDTGSRISYGLNWSSYGNIIGRTSAFIAQTYQFNKDTSFSRDVQNEGHLTDYVGRIYAAPSDFLDLDYRFRLNRKNYDLEYSELGARIGTDLLNMYVSYIYLTPNQNTDESLGDRKELYTSLTTALTKDWSLSIYNRQDLAENGGSLEHGGNLIYEDECFMFITSVKKYDSNDPELDDGYEYTFSFYLKTLGGMGR